MVKPEARLGVGRFGPLRSGQVVCLENVQGHKLLDCALRSNTACLWEAHHGKNQQWLIEGGDHEWTVKNVQTGGYLTAPAGSNGVDYKVAANPHKWRIRQGSRADSYVFESVQYPNITLCNSYGRSNNGNRVWTWLYADGFWDMMSWTPKTPPNVEMIGGSPGPNGDDLAAAKAKQEDLARREAELAEKQKAFSQQQTALRNEQESLKHDRDALKMDQDALQKGQEALKKDQESMTTLDKQRTELEERKKQLDEREQQLTSQRAAPSTRSDQQPSSSGDAARSQKPQSTEQTAKLEALQASNASLTKQLGEARADLALSKVFGGQPNASGDSTAELQAYKAKVMALTAELEKAQTANALSTDATRSSGDDSIATSADASNSTASRSASERQQDQRYTAPQNTVTPGGRQPARPSNVVGAGGRPQPSAPHSNASPLAGSGTDASLRELRDLVRAIRQTQLASIGAKHTGGTLSGEDERVDDSPRRNEAPAPRPGQGHKYVNGAAGRPHGGGSSGGAREFTFLKRL